MKREIIRQSLIASSTKVVEHLPMNTQAQIDRQKHLWHACAQSVQPAWEYTDRNKEIITGILFYINGHAKEYDLNKGLLICGSFGTGKTLIFRILHKYCSITTNPNIYRIESMESMKERFNTDRSFNFYNEYKPNLGRHGVNLCINELGIDYDSSTYGVKFSESFNAFLMQRYELFDVKRTLTHGTTNFAFQDLARKYDAPLFDRFKQMFNVIPLTGKSFRK